MPKKNMRSLRSPLPRTLTHKMTFKLDVPAQFDGLWPFIGQISIAQATQKKKPQLSGALVQGG